MDKEAIISGKIFLPSHSEEDNRAIAVGTDTAEESDIPAFQQALRCNLGFSSETGEAILTPAGVALQIVVKNSAHSYPDMVVEAIDSWYGTYIQMRYGTPDRDNSIPPLDFSDLNLTAVPDLTMLPIALGAPYIKLTNNPDLKDDGTLTNLPAEVKHETLFYLFSHESEEATPYIRDGLKWRTHRNVLRREGSRLHHTLCSELKVSLYGSKTILFFLSLANSLRNLCLTAASGLENLTGLKGLYSLRVLTIHSATNLSSLAGIEGLPSLKKLEITDAHTLPTLAGIEKVPNLEELVLKSVTNLNELTGLGQVAGLRILSIEQADKLKRPSLAVLQELNNLQTLEFLEVSNTNDLDGLEGLSIALKSLTVHSTVSVVGESIMTTGLWNHFFPKNLQGLTALESLDIIGLASLKGVEQLVNLRRLVLRGLFHVFNLLFWQEYPASLEELIIDGARDVEHLIGLEEQIPNLRELHIISSHRKRFYLGLSLAKKLQKLSIHDASELTSGIRYLFPPGIEDLLIGGIASAKILNDLRCYTRLRNITIDFQNSTITSLDAVELPNWLEELTLLLTSQVTTLSGLKGAVRLRCLSLRGTHKLTSLAGLPNAEKLTLGTANGFTTLAGLDKLTRLQALQISCHLTHTALGEVSNLVNLKRLSIGGTTNFPNLIALQKLSKLEELKIDDADNLRDLSGIENLIALRRLAISYTLGLTSLASTQWPVTLEMVTLDSLHNLTDLCGLERIVKLDTLHIICPPRASFLANLGKLSGLRSLRLETIPSLASLASLSWPNDLEELELADFEDLTTLSGIERLTKLRRVVMRNLYNLTDITALNGITSLQELDIADFHLVHLAQEAGVPMVNIDCPHPSEERVAKKQKTAPGYFSIWSASR